VLFRSLASPWSSPGVTELRRASQAALLLVLVYTTGWWNGAFQEDGTPPALLPTRRSHHGSSTDRVIANLKPLQDALLPCGGSVRFNEKSRARWKQNRHHMVRNSCSLGCRGTGGRPRKVHPRQVSMPVVVDS